MHFDVRILTPLVVHGPATHAYPHPWDTGKGIGTPGLWVK